MGTTGAHAQSIQPIGVTSYYQGATFQYTLLYGGPSNANEMSFFMPPWLELRAVRDNAGQVLFSEADLATCPVNNGIYTCADTRTAGFFTVFVAEDTGRQRVRFLSAFAQPTFDNFTVDVRMRGTCSVAETVLLEVRDTVSVINTVVDPALQAQCQNVLTGLSAATPTVVTHRASPPIALPAISFTGTTASGGAQINTIGVQCALPAATLGACNDALFVSHKDGDGAKLSG
ncbi:MAG: hypothetical protein R3C68_11665 [Myxococcota bacterium]